MGTQGHCWVLSLEKMLSRVTSLVGRVVRSTWTKKELAVVNVCNLKRKSSDLQAWESGA